MGKITKLSNGWIKVNDNYFNTTHFFQIHFDSEFNGSECEQYLIVTLPILKEDGDFHKFVLASYSSEENEIYEEDKALIQNII